MYCPNCGEQSGEIALVGDGRVYACSCGWKAIAYTKPKSCESCGGVSFSVRPYDESTKLYGDLCDRCQKEHDEHLKIVEQGGVFWKCASCGRTGVIKPNEFTAAVRESCGIAAPAPCGVEFSPESDPPCPACAQDRRAPNN
jgi:hypothetical protein